MRTTNTKLHEALTSLDKSHNDSVETNKQVDKTSTKSKEKHGNHKNAKASDSSKNANDGGCAKQATSKVVLREALGYGPALSEHIILDAGLLPNMKLGTNTLIDDATIQVLAEAITKFEDWLDDIICGERVPEGFILMQNQSSGKKDVVPSSEGY